MNILALSFMWKTVAALWLVLTLFLILLVLIQKGRGSGLGGAFGGGAAGGGVLGTKTGDFFTWLTIIVVAGFLLLAIVLGIWAANETKNTAPMNQPAPTAPAVPADDQMPQTDVNTTPAQQVDQTAEKIEETVEEVAQDVTQAVQDITEDANAVQ